MGARDLQISKQTNVSLSNGEARKAKRALALALGFLVVATLTGIDMWTDARTGGSALHLVLEGSVVLIGFGLFGVFFESFLRTTRELSDLKSSQRELNEELLFWKREAQIHIEGLSKAIDEQFKSWGLSEKEKELGFLLLKGMAPKEIAEILGKSERTVRQQAHDIYKKTGISGRAELSAFFLEDLLPAKT